MSDKLTRHELSWLLTQEARSAALRLRQGVGMAGSPEAMMPPPLEEGSGGVESTLNRLDDAVNMLASLHGQPTHRGRRGKIDVAALLWEIAPEAKVQIEMGEGLTVFGDESELRRMLHVLLSLSGDPTASARGHANISVRRDGDEVLVGVHLGPDHSATFETERQFLSRMAIRYGGRFELLGSGVTLALPADVDTRRQEVEDLKKELAAAQAQGQAYARELAAVYNRGDGGGAVETPSSIPTRPSHQPPSGDGLTVLVAASRSLTTSLRGILASIGRDLGPLLDREDEAAEIAASVHRHLTGASEILGDLARLGACPVGELPSAFDLAELVRAVVHEDAVRASRHAVEVEVDAPTSRDEVGPQGALTVLFQLLLEHAVTASPPGSKVKVTVSGGPAPVITFDDAGRPLPPRARAGVLSRDFEAMAGRPARFSLIAAYSVAAYLQAGLEIEDSPEGGVRVRLTLPRVG